MPKTLTFQTAVTFLQQVFQELVSVTGDNDASSEPADGIAAAKTGTLTVRTNATDGTLTMAGGHGINTADRTSIFWAGGSRYNVLVGTVSGNSVPFSGGSGDDLPAASTAITATKGTTENVVFTGADAVASLSYWTPQPTDGDGIVEFLQSDGTLVAAFTVTAASPATSWNGAGDTPFTADVGKVRFTHGETSARTMGEITLYN